MTGVLDAHTHVWELAVTPQPWIGPDASPAIGRDFPLGELRAAAAVAGVDRVVLVQSANDAPETSSLLAQAAGDPLVAGVVGWTDLAGPGCAEAVEAALDDPDGAPLCGYRHVFEPGEAAGWLRSPAVGASLDVLGRHGLAFDLLLGTQELPLAAEVARRHPGTVFVLDHLAKPAVRAGRLDPWRRDLVELGRSPNVYAKVSGLPEQADWARWGSADLRPFFHVALEALGPGRLIFATDWPVCTVAGSYEAVVAAQLELCAELGPAERDLVLSGNAARAYRRTTSAASPG